MSWDHYNGHCNGPLIFLISRVRVSFVAKQWSKSRVRVSEMQVTIGMAIPLVPRPPAWAPGPPGPGPPAWAQAQEPILMVKQWSNNGPNLVLTIV